MLAGGGEKLPASNVAEISLRVLTQAGNTLCLCKKRGFALWTVRAAVQNLLALALKQTRRLSS